MGFMHWWGGGKACGDRPTVGAPLIRSAEQLWTYPQRLLPLWESTDHQGAVPALSICPLVVRVHLVDSSF